MEMKKLLAIGIIFLFIGVAVAPSINFTVVKASNDNDLMEVTTQACGIKGYGNTTVKLTREQYQNLEEYLVEFRARLNQTSTREEAVPIFKEAVVELDKYGLLPKGMSVERAEKLTTRYEKSTGIKNRVASSLKSSGFSNLFCMIAGRATKCFLAGPIITGFRFIISLILSLAAHYMPLWDTLSAITTWLLIIRNDFPPLSEILSFFSLFSLLTFGIQGYYPGTQAAEGWIYTAGILGIKNYTGSFFGKILYPVKDYFFTLYTGAFGFTGIKILFPNYSSFFLGTALRVNIDDSPP
jgi:hypothetical protein